VSAAVGSLGEECVRVSGDKGRLFKGLVELCVVWEGDWRCLERRRQGDERRCGDVAFGRNGAGRSKRGVNAWSWKWGVADDVGLVNGHSTKAESIAIMIMKAVIR
jgi:hypothetical protein